MIITIDTAPFIGEATVIEEYSESTPARSIMANPGDASLTMQVTQSYAINFDQLTRIQDILHEGIPTLIDKVASHAEDMRKKDTHLKAVWKELQEDLKESNEREELQQLIKHYKERQ